MADENHQAFLLWDNCQSWGASLSDVNPGAGGRRDLGKKPILPMAPPPPPSSSIFPAGPVMVSAEPEAAALEAHIKRKRAGDGDGNGSGDNGGGEVKEGRCGELDHDQSHIWTERERRRKMKNMFANLHAMLPYLPPKIDKSTIVVEAVKQIKTLEDTVQKLEKQKLEKLQGLPTTTTFSVGSSSMTSTPQKHSITSSREAFLADAVGSAGNSGGGVATIEATNNIINSSNVLRPVAASQHPMGFQTWTSTNVVLSICGDEAQITVRSSKKTGLLSTVCLALERHKLQLVSAHVSNDTTGRKICMVHAKVNRDSDPQSIEDNIPVVDICKQAATEVIWWIQST